MGGSGLARVRGMAPVVRGRLLSMRCANHPKNLRVERWPRIVRLSDAGQLRIGHGSILYEGLVLAFDSEDASISIGEQCFVNRDVKLVARRSITIGRRCEVGWDVSITDSDFHQLEGDRPATAPVVIGDHVWLGARATVLKGVTIGDGVVVAAGAMVVRDVPPKSLVAGVPARVVRHDVAWRNLRSGE